MILNIGPYPTSANTGGWTHNLPRENLIILHPSYCSIGKKIWKGLHFAPVIRKLIVQLEQHRPFGNQETSPPHMIHATEQLSSTCLPSDVLTQDKFWPHLSSYFQPGDCIIAETGTAQFGSLDLILPNNVQYFSQFYYGSIGFTVGATLGVLIARKEMQQPGRVILLIGDGSIQLTIQEIGTMIRQGFTPTIFLINNAGYTIERAIHGPNQGYNDISTQWDYQRMLSFFGARNPGNYAAKTFGELDHVLQSDEFRRSDRIQLLELFFDKMDSPWRLLRQIEIMSARARGEGVMKRDAIV